MKCRGTQWFMALALGMAGYLTAAATDTRLIDAARKQDAKLVRSLLAQHVNVDATEADGSTALHWAAQRDNVEIAGLLLGAGADVKATNRFNITPLYFACTN